MALKSKKAPAKATGTGKASKTAESKPSRALTPFEEMDLLFDRLSRGLMTRMGFPALGDTGWPLSAHAPKVDVVDRGKDLVVRAEIPGVSKEDLSISLTDNTLTIRGETHKETKQEKGDYHRREISRGSFLRSVALPAEVAGDRAKATFKNGVLELVLPKLDKPSGRKIEIG